MFKTGQFSGPFWVTVWKSTVKRSSSWCLLQNPASTSVVKKKTPAHRGHILFFLSLLRYYWHMCKFKAYMWPSDACIQALSHFSHVRLFSTLWTVARQALLSMGFSRWEYWSGLPWPPLGDLPDPELEPMSLTSSALAGRFFTTSTTWEIWCMYILLDNYHNKVCNPTFSHASHLMNVQW